MAGGPPTVGSGSHPTQFSPLGSNL